jgi:RHS repeat-associated protein
VQRRGPYTNLRGRVVRLPLRRRATRKVNNVVQGSEEYWYDGNGQRMLIVKRDAAGVKTELVWFIGDVEAHYDAAGAVTKVYSHLSLGSPVARVERTGNTTAAIEYQFHGLGSSTIAAVDQGGTINASFSYAPFGEVLEATNAGGVGAGTVAHKRRMNDKFEDDVSGLAYYGARYYDKTLNGWTQADPLYTRVPDAAQASSPRRANVYVFSLQNSLRYLDPDGLDSRGPVEAPIDPVTQRMHDLAGRDDDQTGTMAKKAAEDAYWRSLWRRGSSGNNMGDRGPCGGGLCEQHDDTPPFVSDIKADMGRKFDTAASVGAALQRGGGVAADMTPLWGTVRAFARGDYLNGVISAVGDITLVLGIGAEIKGLVAVKGGAETFEILNGVRRAKAAHIAGQTTIEAEVHVGGRVISRSSIPIDALRSPKASISTAGAGLDRWQDTVRQTMSGSRAPAITVTPGSRGTPIPHVSID